MNMFTDYYALLGVSVDASTSEIKAAFKKLALQYHPDVYKGEDAHERMREILRAYQTLSDDTARKQYDARRSEHTLDTLTGRNASSTFSTSSSTMNNVRATQGKATRVSSSARRDRQRSYDFPDMHDSSPVRVSLLNMEYALSLDEAQTLRQQGLLRGIAPETRTHDYYCHRCKHTWPVSPALLVNERRLPLFCPACGAHDWAEYLLLRCVHCCAVFESEQIRNQVGSIHYGNAARATSDLCPPYELFPLCPYCGVAHWCPEEEMRVSHLRASLARKAALMRWLWISITLCVILVLGMFALSTLH
jgi:hypothetical protein